MPFCRKINNFMLSLAALKRKFALHGCSIFEASTSKTWEEDLGRKGCLNASHSSVRSNAPPPQKKVEELRSRKERCTCLLECLNPDPLASSLRPLCICDSSNPTTSLVELTSDRPGIRVFVQRSFAVTTDQACKASMCFEW
ncbi:hypothetical protein K402DRAFT_219150 [Aulographum hederae CBS 113979]|uniref:Uncharacterized protein n=1 Tax=Aulographum hederae CBS 113979 TaxID=1176131 RepID=A0A6G1GMA5_9PEZI|nr:hypothetical protein K402DRAFT_219150 [Aulographum hederae CBS 113979]